MGTQFGKLSQPLEEACSRIREVIMSTSEMAEEDRAVLENGMHICDLWRANRNEFKDNRSMMKAYLEHTMKVFLEIAGTPYSYVGRGVIGTVGELLKDLADVEAAWIVFEQPYEKNDKGSGTEYESKTHRRRKHSRVSSGRQHLRSAKGVSKTHATRKRARSMKPRSSRSRSSKSSKSSCVSKSASKRRRVYKK